jgi:hypothetical protein
MEGRQGAKGLTAHIQPQEAGVSEDREDGSREKEVGESVEEDVGESFMREAGGDERPSKRGDWFS